MRPRAKLHGLEQILSFRHHNNIHQDVLEKNNGKISNALAVGQKQKVGLRIIGGSFWEVNSPFL